MRGLPVVFIGLLQGLSSAIGILGTLSYEWLSARVGTVRGLGAYVPINHIQTCTHIRYTSAVFPSVDTTQQPLHRPAPASWRSGAKSPA